MKKVIQFTLSICFLIGFCFTLQAQEEALSPAFKEAAIGELSKLMNDFYIFPEVAKTTSEHLNSQLAAGHFNQFKILASFSEALTTEAQSINKDKHLLIRPSRPMEAKENSTEGMFERHMYQMAFDRSNAGGFKAAKKLEGNVGYFDIRSFANLWAGKAYTDSYMQLVSTSDALIIDLRKNGGGDPAMVQYLCSYFFDKKVHLNSLYYREGDRTQEYWTLDKVDGEKMPDIPLFVLTSEKTFSGAEEFSYNMQTQKRATLVGETTGGGANPVRFLRINEQIEVYMPIGKAINPITKTNWEGVGVIPEIKTAAKDALTKAHELAKVAAKKSRETIQQKQKALSDELVNSLDSFDPTTGATTVYEKLKKCTKAG
jgi:hypothetical protein